MVRCHDWQEELVHTVFIVISILKVNVLQITNYTFV